MKIGLLGASFNPAHLGHLYISNLALKKLGLNQVWWFINDNPLKDQAAYKPYESRLEGCEQILQNHPKIKIKNIFRECIYTYDLVQKLKKKYPQAKFYFIIGADNLENFHRWKNFKKLLGLVEFVVFSREGYVARANANKAIQLYKKMRETKGEMKKVGKTNKVETKNNLPKISIMRNKNYDISSTKLRQLQK